MEDTSAVIVSLKNYLNSIAPVLLNMSASVVLNQIDSLETSRVLQSFCNQPDAIVLYAEKMHRDESEDVVAFSLDIEQSQNVISTVSLIKNQRAPLVANIPISSQIVLNCTCGGGAINYDGNQSVAASLESQIRYAFVPKVKVALQYAQLVQDNKELENLSIIQRKLRELDLAFEQCRITTLVPRVIFEIPPSLQNVNADIAQLRRLIERYDASQVDTLFRDIQLAPRMGHTEEEKDAFVNNINNVAKLWPAEMGKQTLLMDLPFPQSIAKEMEFLKDYESKVSDTKLQLDSSIGILLTKLVLKRANRVSESIIREAEVEFDKCIAIVHGSYSFLKDFPADGLVFSTNVYPQLLTAACNCVLHFSKPSKRGYPIERASKLLDLLCHEILNRLIQILKEKKIMRSSYEDFLSTRQECVAFFEQWTKEYTSMRKNIVDSAKHNNIKITDIKNIPANLVDPLNQIYEFRENHHKLSTILQDVLLPEDNYILIELNDLYKPFVPPHLDVLDISNDGKSAWQKARLTYDKRLEKLEGSITSILSDRLKNSKSTDEKFRLFSLFNPLLFRPNIWKAVNPYRTSLIKNVYEDVEKLQSKFMLKYDESYERETADIRDIPPLSGRILWARQIENQLNVLLQRMGNVLGAKWEDQPDAKKLREICNQLFSILNVDKMVKDWNNAVAGLATDVADGESTILVIKTDQSISKAFLHVNFDPKLVHLFKEIRHLKWLVPGATFLTLERASEKAFARYPFASSIETSLNIFESSKKKLPKAMAILLMTYDSNIRECVQTAVYGSKVVGSTSYKTRMKWDSDTLSEWVENFSRRVIQYEGKVEDAVDKSKKIEELLNKLRSCAYQRDAIFDILNAIQLVVNDMHMRGFSNITHWVQQMDSEIESILKLKLTDAINLWMKIFEHGGSTEVHSSEQFGRLRSESSIKVEESTLVSGLSLGQTVHQILLANQLLFISPPIEEACSKWISNFHNYISIATKYERISSSRFNVFESSNSAKTAALKDYSNVLSQVDPTLLKRVFRLIRDCTFEAKIYSQEWLQYQVLWDVSIGSVTNKVGRDVGLWHKLLQGVKEARATIDSEMEEKSFGPIVVNFRQVQNKVNSKYDTWQKELQIQFAAITMEEIKSLNTELVTLRRQLEAVELQGSTKDVISGVEFVMKMRHVVASKATIVQELESSEKLLIKQRHQFSRDYLYVSNITSAYGDLLQIMQKQSKAMDSQLSLLQTKIRQEDKDLVVRVEDFSRAWEGENLVNSKISPEDVLHKLSDYNAQVEKLKEEFSRLMGAKAALGMDISEDDRLDLIIQEVKDLREVCKAVIPAWEKLQILRAMDLKSVVVTKLRKDLDAVTGDLNSLPNKVRSYLQFEFLQQTISKCMSFQPILRDLTSEALKERHWRVLFKALNIGSSSLHTQLKLGVVWELNLVANKKVIGDQLAIAQGELALEQYIKEVKDYWTNMQLTFVSRDSIRLISDWNILFGMLEDHLNSLVSLKQSPYFLNVPEFQEDANAWESKLTHLRGIFEIWIEVQRKWIYLSGIFRNADIKSQLQTQYHKFKSVDGEFTRLMKRVSNKPQIHEILSIDGVLSQLERQDSTMTAIQKALGEYLEKQRQKFPRFYFVNNEDLVEIIGNSNEPTKIFSHLSKMFAGITVVLLSNETTTNAEGNICHKGDAIFSREGEKVPLCNAIDLSLDVKEWLGTLEREMVFTLATLLQQAVSSIPKNDNSLLQWINKFPAQIIILASQVDWTNSTQGALGKDKNAMVEIQSVFESKLKLLSQSVLQDVDPALRKKCEQLITEVVHQRDVTRLLISSNISNKNDFGWEYHLRFYWNPKENDLMKRLEIKMSNASFFYGFEYLGISERLVQTSLTDRCYLTLTQALHLRMGGNPFGPAGTGKTESVKMLGSQLGRFVLVFNCDENFDYAAMGRIFAGLCQVGAWGCFDEFNRLEERILSAVSQQILTIQRGLMSHQEKIELLGMPCKLHRDVGIFVTMNPGYAGRSNLPDNLKQLFRAVAMVVPDRKMIAQVMLFSQGITTAEELAGKVVLLFTLCEEQLSLQSHYDFGLRALKSVLTGAGDLKRQALTRLQSSESHNMSEIEKNVLIRSTCNSVVPKLVADDLPLFTSLLQAVFPGIEVPSVNDDALLVAIRAICAEESLEAEDVWVEKVLQLRQVLELRHGVIMAGPSGTGKSTSWRVLLKALGRVDNVKGDFYVIDPKSIKKDKLYGTLDPTTLEWTDGVFTKLLRKITESDNIRTGVARRSWIVFDGDVDPEWAENLNSVLDDNKILTLPSGDRLKLPQNMRIMMEVDTLKHATLATVSRCGMIWFPENTVTLEMQYKKLLNNLRSGSIQLIDLSSSNVTSNAIHKMTQGNFVDILEPFMTSKDGIVDIALSYALKQPHIMDAKCGRLLTSLQALLGRGIALAIDYNETNIDLPMSDDHMEQFASKWLLFSVLWAFGASMATEKRQNLSDMILKNSTIGLPNTRGKLIDYNVDVSTGKFVEWSSMVPPMEIESHKVTATDVVVTTTDTIRHVEVLQAWLSSHKPFILCGPPGSGKTMTLTSVIDSTPGCILASLNFSSGTTPDLILKTFTQYCEIIDSPDGLVMQPSRQSYSEDKWLVIFCDEINLPEQDKYGTQRVIMFMRQLTEQGGFWNKDCKWIHLRRIQFVGACNPPTDAGRVTMSERFMRHAPLMLVDYPSVDSLHQIYRCFNHGLLKLHPNLRGIVDTLTESMVEFYSRNKERFTPEMAPQYIYSPRELSRWVRALYEAMEPLDAMTMEEMVRLWGHEALRLFQDRLITEKEKEWCSAQLDEVARKNFGSIDIGTCLARPLLYSNWLSKTYQSVKIDDLRLFVAARLKVFYEEELDVPLVIFDDVLEHILRIDNVLRHPMGHLLLVGESGVGKTVMSRFVSWMNGLSVFQIKANNRYTVENFDEDLRGLLRRVGVEGEKVCFIFDESNALSSAFLERMNALLASGEVPGLFEGDELAHLLTSLQGSVTQRDSGADTTDELWRKFTRQVQRNLHVVFTMNPASTDFDSRCKTSPALFNRCVVDWYGTWSQTALAQVAWEFTACIDTGYATFEAPSHESDILYMVKECLKSQSAGDGLHESIVAGLVSVHNSVKNLTVKLGKTSGRQHYLSPRDFLDLIKKFVTTEQEKRSMLQDHQSHIRTGLDKLLETENQVTELSHEMVNKGHILRTKDAEANLKLTQMVEKQNEAEQRKSIAEELSVKLQKQNEEIRIRKDAVESELSQAEPALIAAKQSVQNIKRTQLDEVRALARPPTAVQSTMEMVATMMGEKNIEWGELRKFIRRDDFISTVVNFDPMTLTPKLIRKVQEYLNNPELDYSSVDRASKACGPLFQWASSQINYALILRKVTPLREEVESLEVLSNSLLTQKQEAVRNVEELESAIKQYKIDYATAIRDTETIRSEMIVVTNKVARAESLLSSLNEEKERWKATSSSFDEQMSTLIGDCLLAASFLTYAGIFDHRSRKTLMEEWSVTLRGLGISFRDHLDLTGYLSTPSQQLTWKSYGLPTDELAIQNCILLERFNRYPMVVDPSGQATAFFLRKYADQKIVQTSFLDASFLKTLASCVRFGNPLLVQDVETLDPILNPVLNKEFQKTGGRTLIRIGTDDIDFSPKFMIILTTRNPFARFAPDLCSRVTMVNFTVTPASLEAQVLSKVLHAERPDVDRRRTEIFKLQSEQSAKLRELEEALLNKISAVQGAILDDDSLVKTLEVIKAEAAELNKEVMSTAAVLTEVKLISNIYEPLATAVATVYFSLERLSDVSFLYQFSLHFFLSVVEKVLHENRKVSKDEGTAITNESKMRLATLSNSFYTEISRRVLRGLKFEDKLMFVARLAQISTLGQPAKQLSEFESDFLYRGLSPVIPSNQEYMFDKWKVVIDGCVLSDSMARNLLAISQIQSFSGLYASMTGNTEQKKQWHEAYCSIDAENNLPIDWIGSNITQERAALLRLAIVQILRADRVMAALENYVTAVFTEDFNWREYSKMDLREIVERDSLSSVPIMLCSEMGQDASSKVDSLALAMGHTLLQVAMGSIEGYTEADKSISQACKTGAWVILRNVHLCPEWLSALEKRIHGLTPHSEFRLFLTCEINPCIPTSLLRASDVVFAEASTGIKANLQRFSSSINAQRINRGPVERSRLYMLLGWLNAVVHERLRYAPLGWTKRYEFSDADTACAVDCLDQWVDAIAGKKSHISPEEIPWDALRTTISQSLYGGRIDNQFDQAVLDSFINSVFTADNYGASVAIAVDHSFGGHGMPLLTLPNSFGSEAFDSWIKSLPDKNSPSWLGLPATAENQLQELMGRRVLSRFPIVQGTMEEVELSSSDGADANFMLKSILDNATNWLVTTLPKGFDMMQVGSDSDRSSDVTATPLQRCLAREVCKGQSALARVREDLASVCAYCEGQAKGTNAIRDLIKCLAKGIIPPSWKSAYVTTPNTTLGSWMTDLAARCASIEVYDKPSELKNGFWLGGMFAPEAFITATRQNTAQVNQWSLEELELYLEIGCAIAEGGQDTIVDKLVLESAQWTPEEGLELSPTLRCRLPPSRLRWRRRCDRPPGDFILFPVYLNETRATLVVEVLVSLPSHVPTHVWVQRGTAFIMQLSL